VNVGMRVQQIYERQDRPAQKEKAKSGIKARWEAAHHPPWPWWRPGSPGPPVNAGVIKRIEKQTVSVEILMKICAMSCQLNVPVNTIVLVSTAAYHTKKDATLRLTFTTGSDELM
jgi:hypothetical protein